MDAEYSRPYIDTLTGETVMLTDRAKDADVEARYREIQPGQLVSPAGGVVHLKGDNYPPGVEVAPVAAVGTIRGIDRATGRELE